MVLPLYLAMTAAEIRASVPFPPLMGYMACHFSPYGTGLSNCPKQLPENAMLILNDRTPIHGHDHGLIASQLTELVEKLRCGSVLLDFQRSEEAELSLLAGKLSEALSCPVGTSHFYAKDLDCAVFLPPLPPDTPLAECLIPWAGRDIWLDVSPQWQELTLTEKGCTSVFLPPREFPESCHAETELHCHYRIEVYENARFTLFRTEEDLEMLVKEAAGLGATRVVGLYQEWRM